MKKKNIIPKNYLEQIPVRREGLAWSQDDNGIVTLEIENKGIFNTIAQKLFKKPRISYIHLDEMGSFIWPLLAEDQDIIALGKKVEERFGEAANPLYERLVKYLQILESYHFITWKA
jgi:hypothetical protein